MDMGNLDGRLVDENLSLEGLTVADWDRIRKIVGEFKVIGHIRPENQRWLINKLDLE